VPEPGPPRQDRRVQPLALPDEPGEDADDLEDHGADGDRPEGVPERHAEAERGGDDEGAERRELADALGRDREPVVARLLRDPRERVVVGCGGCHGCSSGVTTGAHSVGIGLMGCHVQSAASKGRSGAECWV
jgi:hypothetical protein